MILITNYQALKALYDKGCISQKNHFEVRTDGFRQKRAHAADSPGLQDTLESVSAPGPQFNWTLQFVRREGRDVPLPVIRGADGKAVATIDEDGNLNMNPDIVIRDNSEDMQHKKAG